MNLYVMLGSSFGTHQATALSVRLSTWHDAMVAHERRLRTGVTSDACSDECPHAEARILWPEALATFGARAHELIFLRSRGRESDRRSAATVVARAPRAAADTGRSASGRDTQERGALAPHHDGTRAVLEVSS
jgi:hypothetical protein